MLLSFRRMTMGGRVFEQHGFDIMEAASVTGHRTLSMLKRYTNLRAENLARKLG